MARKDAPPSNEEPDAVMERLLPVLLESLVPHMLLVGHWNPASIPIVSDTAAALSGMSIDITPISQRPGTPSP